MGARKHRAGEDGKRRCGELGGEGRLGILLYSLLRRELRDLQYKLFISILSRFCSIDHDFLSFGGNNFPFCHCK